MGVRPLLQLCDHDYCRLKSAFGWRVWRPFFETALTAAATKVKGYHHPLQVSGIAIQVCPALQSMQFKRRFCQ